MSQSGSYGIGGSGSTFVQTLTGNVGGPVGPTGGNIDIIGLNVIDVLGNPGLSTLNIELTNGTNGQLLIGGGVQPIWANLTSPDSSVVFTPGANSLGIEVAGNFSNTFNGDSGSATPALGIIAFTGGTNGGFFTAAGSTLTLSFNYLKLPDTTNTGDGIIYFNNVPYFHNYGSSVPGADNLFIGANAGNTAFTPNFADWNLGIGTDVLSSIINGAIANTSVGYQSSKDITNGTHNTVMGYQSCLSLTSGSSNTALGYNTLRNLTEGNNNICIGDASGNNLTFTEDNNILIGNGGVTGNSAEIRIGDDAIQDTCYIAGIITVDVGSVATVVSLDNATGQLGETAITAGTGITVTPGANTITISSSGTTSLAYTNVNSTPYVVLVTDQYLSVDCSGGGITVQLPNAATLGQVFTIKDRTGNANTNNITVTTVGGLVNIDGATTYVMNTQYAAIQVIGNGSTYEIF